MTTVIPHKKMNEEGSLCLPTFRNAVFLLQGGLKSACCLSEEMHHHMSTSTSNARPCLLHGVTCIMLVCLLVLSLRWECRRRVRPSPLRWCFTADMRDEKRPLLSPLCGAGVHTLGLAWSFKPDKLKAPPSLIGSSGDTRVSAHTRTAQCRAMLEFSMPRTPSYLREVLTSPADLICATTIPR